MGSFFKTLYLPKMYLYVLICLQKTGAEIGEFLAPMVLLSYSYKKWTLISMSIFEKKSHPIRPVEGLKLCLDFLCNTDIT